MNYIDLSVVVIIILSSLLGMSKGIIISLVSFSGWIASFCLTHYSYEHYVVVHFAQYLESSIAVFVVYVSLMSVFLLLFGVINIILRLILSPISNNGLNKVLGLIFGIVRGILISIIVFVVFNISYMSLNNIAFQNRIGQSLPLILKDSYSYPFLIRSSNILLAYAPDYIFSNLYHTEDVSDSSMQEAQRYIDQLYNYIDDDTKDKIKNQMTSKHFNHKNSEKKYLLKNLLNEYQKNLISGKIHGDDTISHDVLLKILKITKDNEVLY